MAELADAPDSKSGSRKRVGVRPSLWAPSVHGLAVGAAQEVLVLNYDRIVHETDVDHTPDTSVDMTRWVAYSLRS